MGVTFDTAARTLEGRLTPGSFGHCERVARTSADLARIYGLDVEEAALAGLLHDWDRELDHDTLRAAAEQTGVSLTEADERSPRLLHAATGARALREEFPGLSEDVLRAVERHTVGAVEMGPLDMVVYVADMIEPGRVYPGVDDLREAAGTLSLDELFAEAYRRSVMHLVKGRRYIHPDTVAVWNAHVARSTS